MEVKIWDKYCYDYHWYDNSLVEFLKFGVVRNIEVINGKITKLDEFNIEWCRPVTEEEYKKYF